jgi:ABC-type sugar transport system ATPase subunit
VRALRGAHIEVRAGEVHALVGENGAGKSTLIKVVTGAHRPDQGRIEIGGAPVAFAGPIDAFNAGIAAIYQEFNLVPALTVRENLFLGRERSRRGRVDATEERRRTAEVLGRLGGGIDPDARIRDLDVARQQIVEIARALLADARLLIMDEPTATLAPKEVEHLFGILRELRSAGHGILFVSHRLDEVAAISDRITVMRDGETLGTWTAAELPEARLIELMVGRPLGTSFPARSPRLGPEVLRAEGLRGGRVRGASFALRAGEVLGIAGLVGAGRTDLARLIFGADRPEGGCLLLDGAPIAVRSPREAIGHGIALLTEDRKGQGLVLGLSARENFALPNLGRWSRFGWIATRKESSAFMRYVESLNIRVAGPEQAARNLSGGNQQKLLIARWLENDARVLLFDEPTRGIDVGSKHETYNLIRDLASRGKAIVMISSELPEVLGMSDRILVMHEGRITGEVTDVESATQEQLLRLAVA